MVLEYFTPVSGFFGGGLIGLSAGLLLLFSGEILGSSGIASSIVLEPKKHLTTPMLAWKLVFMSTFLLFSNICLAKYFTDDSRLGVDPSIPVVSKWGYLLGGLFVGFGTRLGNGCTTGHGICGMARLSLRSFVAVCTFMFSAFATAAMLSPDNKAFAKGTEFLRTDTVPELFNRWLGFGCSFIFVIPTCYALYNLFKQERRRRSLLVELEKRASQISPQMSLADLESTTDFSKTALFSVNNSQKDQADYGSSKDDVLEEIENSGKTVEQDIEKAEGVAQQPEKASSSTDGSCSEKSVEVVDDQEMRQRFIELQAQVRHARKRLADGKIAPAALASCIFALGLAISQMVLPSKVLGFLSLYSIAYGTYDPTLLTVMVGGAFVSFLSYQFVEGWGLLKNPWARKNPLASSSFCVPTNNTIDWKLLFGAFCFGVGWATAGLCPGPATFLAASGTKPVLAFWWPFYYVGAFGAQKLKDRYP